jgi:hypothetical protein
MNKVFDGEERQPFAAVVGPPKVILMELQSAKPQIQKVRHPVEKISLGQYDPGTDRISSKQFHLVLLLIDVCGKLRWFYRGNRPAIRAVDPVKTKCFGNGLISPNSGAIVLGVPS